MASPTLDIRGGAVPYTLGRVQGVDWTWVAISLFAIFLAVMGLHALSSSNVKEFFVITQAILCVLSPRILGRALSAMLPSAIELLIALHVGMTLVGGELMHLYERIWWWDIPPHLLAGFLAAYIAEFVLVRALGTRLASMRTYVLVSIIAVVAAVGFSGVWELYEFMADQFFGTIMQPSAADTMYDMVAGTLGGMCILLLPYRRFTTRS